MATSGENKDGPAVGHRTVLCVGNCCVDFINVVKEFPKEDSDQRGLQYYWQRGGNATNNCTVLSQLSVPCEFMGILGSRGAEADWVKEDFKTSNIDFGRCVVKDVQCPVATSILSETTGTRTIMYYPRDRPELSYTEFRNTFNEDFSNYSWIHFELCSNVEDIGRMMDDVIAYRNGLNVSKVAELHKASQHLVVSVEVEKPEFLNSESVIARADVVFLSKDFAMSRGHENAEGAVREMYSLCRPGAVLICAWGERGAAARCGADVKLMPAQKITVVDSLGAGDTFVAGCIVGFLSRGFVPGNEQKCPAMIEHALKVGCSLAALKCLMFGYKGLKTHASDILKQ